VEIIGENGLIKNEQTQAIANVNHRARSSHVLRPTEFTNLTASRQST